MGESTDIVQKEMYTFQDAGGRSLTLRPEGTAPVCRAYLEHGMHTLAQPVKLWYLGSYYRQEKPQAGRFRQFWQLGAEAIGSDDPAVDAELIALLHDAARRARACAGCACAWARWAASTRAPSTASAWPPTCASTPTGSRATCASASTSTRCAPSTPRTPAPRRSCATRRCCSTRSSAEDREHFDEVCARLRVAGIDWELDGTLVRGIDYYTRTIFEFTSDALGAQSGVAGGGRYDGLIELLGGPPTPGHGLGGGPRADAAGRRRAAGARGRSPTSSSPTRTAGSRPSRWPRRRAPRGSPSSRSWPGAR